jgi:hypothetical protein
MENKWKKIRSLIKKTQLKKGEKQSQPGPICQPHDPGDKIKIIL